ncbi:hypothetical protein BLS_001667 [Venturia inaequalis]|uniref:Mitochondrial F1F0 ATP synthase subunit Atp14 n=1 Tax=Venturia inaequalis TaxID=5025 RepID=A0A8H3Z8U5_VENIN|nr:hypothetical protein EG328_011778 [Venturia inaequalis]KAE9984672.1 hypothetical protein BLS_001667 [Venturia inaequalis]RDI88888.1 hypothetical protein Vi05172_g1568 [Venturia inaequalis]
MFSQSIRAARPLVTRMVRPTMAARRSIMTPTAVRSADLVQELYLRELKSYKPSPVKATDADGHVQKFSVPAAPKSPEEGDLANDLKSYETQTVELEGSSSGPGGAAPVEEDWFEEEEEETAAAH